MLLRHWDFRVSIEGVEDLCVGLQRDQNRLRRGHTAGTGKTICQSNLGRGQVLGFDFVFCRYFVRILCLELAITSASRQQMRTAHH